MGLAQLLDIDLHAPRIFKLAAAEFQTGGNVRIDRLRSEASSLPPRIDFEDTWWLEKDGDLFIPQSVSLTAYHISYHTFKCISSMPTIAVFV